MSNCEMKQCPKCKATWEDPRGEIPEVLFKEVKRRYDTMEEAEAEARDYGWTPENGLRFSHNVVGIQYPHLHPQAYDGVSEWVCGECGARIGRWTQKILAEDESEQRFGGGNL